MKKELRSAPTTKEIIEYFHARGSSSGGGTSAVQLEADILKYASGVLCIVCSTFGMRADETRHLDYRLMTLHQFPFGLDKLWFGRYR